MLCCTTHPDFAVSLHDSNLNVLGSSLHDFEQTLDRELDGFILCQVVLVVLL